MPIARVQLPISIDPEKETSLQNQIVDGISELILEGRIAPNTRLPASRALSIHLGVSRNTIKIAYQNLISQGLLVGHGTKGTFVCSALPSSLIMANREKGQVDYGRQALDGMQSSSSTDPNRLAAIGEIRFDIGSIDPTLAPERTWRRLFIEHLPQKTRNLRITEPAGLLSLRESIATTICPLRGMDVSPENIAIVSSEYRALDIVIRSILSAGDRVAVEDPCDAGLLFFLKSQGVEIVPIPVDEDGMVVARIWNDAPKVVFITPPHQRPTGAALRTDRREAILAWAEETGGIVVERDSFGEFSYEETSKPALYAAGAKDHMIYINSFVSWMGDSMQMGYIVAPDNFMQKILAVKYYLCPNPGWLNQRVAADFISSERFFGHLRRVRMQLKTRRDAMLDGLQRANSSLRISGHPAGSHLVLHLPDNMSDARSLQTKAKKVSVVIPTLYDDFQSFSKKSDFDPDRTLLLGFAALSEEMARTGISRLLKVAELGD